ncbi:hypothetical protein UFOVP726_3 [uncultured Caudovirales phage]|uniref:Uncharacterized protein n=1 Tax=uncultured Caudovirales phage TaxID=2100421 RepID=A0A6J5NM22_9CAUD|nr:hypothetical protein UFOVP726_3 [uncultured Caudovirales phage]
MKVKITHLGAPWPEGAGVGSLVAFPAGIVPAWAVGKCVEDEGEEDAQFSWEAPTPAAPAAPALPPGVAEALAKAAEATAALQATVEKQAETIAALQATVDDFAARAAAAVGELVVNPASDDEAPAGTASAPATTAARKRAQNATG